MSDTVRNNATMIWQMVVVFVALIAFWWNLQQALESKTDQLSTYVNRLERRQDTDDRIRSTMDRRLTTLESHSRDQDDKLAERVKALAAEMRLELRGTGRVAAAETTTNTALLDQILKTLQDVETRLRKIEAK